MQNMNEPVYTLELPQSVAMLCLNALRKGPLEQVEYAHGVLMQQIEKAETARQLKERDRLVEEALRTREQSAKTAEGAAAPVTPTPTPPCADCAKNQ